MRGEINHRKRAKQLRDFSGLQFERGITPTDIDCSVDFNGGCFVFAETKLNGAVLPKGQRLHIKHLIDNLIKPSIFFITTHDTEDPSEDIDMAKTVVTEYYYNGKWKTVQREVVLRDAMEGFKSRLD